MQYVFRLRVTPAARLALPRREQGAVLDELSRRAEAQAHRADEYAIFDVHEYGLKAIVHFHERVIYLLNPAEYRTAGLPGSPADLN